VDTETHGKDHATKPRSIVEHLILHASTLDYVVCFADTVNLGCASLVNAVVISTPITARTSG